MAANAVKIPFTEAAAPSTPAANKVVIYAKSDGLMYSKDDAGAETLMSSGSSGNVATDSIWDAAGDLAVGSGSNTAAKLSIGATNGMTLARVSGAVAWALPPGYEFDYAQKTSNTTVTATAAGSADTIITGNAVSYDGSTVVVITFCSTFVSPPSGQDITIGIFESTTEVGRIAYLTAAGFSQVHGSLRLTPSNASHTYLIKAWVSSGSATVGGGASGAASTPAFMRITKV